MATFIIHIDGNGNCTSCGNPCTEQAPCQCVQQSSGYSTGGASAECGDKLQAKCVFWTSTRIPFLGIEKDARLTAVITKIVDKLANHEERLNALEP